MKKKKGYIFGIVPLYAVIPLISSFVFNTVIYSGTMILRQGAYHHNFTTAFDRMVPVIPAFTSIYLICYLFYRREMKLESVIIRIYG